MKDIKGYEGKYAITSCGKVWSYVSKKFLKPDFNKGYLRARLYKDGKVQNYLIHRLVAEAYIPNPDNLEVVDHIDNNKLNNNINNLQWFTVKQNNVKALAQKVYCFETDTIYESVSEASRMLNIPRSSIHNWCEGVHSLRGLHFKYIGE